ncbi:hypothetical protein BG015_000999 [Linnemannia schmuckeri]|uniref:Uncharacterized protein n=1 Tax=Linnemannia schmuckeri TaxID=64567 RepID=A0A9P5RSF4_9FUNG|nr:hypothetical protein BG015_000999 [Linnemannia schmuckeri]
MTPEHAFTVLDALFSKLGSLQRPQLPASPSFGETNRPVQEDSSFESISEAIWTLRNNDAEPALQEFFDQAFSSLYAQVTKSIEKEEDMVLTLTPQLGFVNRIIHATYHAWTRSRRDSWTSSSDSVSEPGILFGSIVSQLLEPVWIFFRDIRQQQGNDVDGSQEDEKNMCVLLQVEIILASLLPTLLTICVSSKTHLLGFMDFFYLVVRIFDEALLPIHLSPECDEGVIHLVAGLLALFQTFETLDHVHLVTAIQDQLLSGLFSSDILERTIRSLQATNSNLVATVTYERFVERLLCLGGIFTESVPEEEAIRTTMAGDTLPGLGVLATFNLWESIPLFFANEKSLDHLYGASWVQLSYVYVTLDRFIDPKGADRRPFSFATILEGLQYSVQGAEERSLSHSILTVHVEELLEWFWSHDGKPLQCSTAKDPPDTLLGMMFMLLEKEFSLGVTAGIGQRRLLSNDSKMDRVIQLFLKCPVALSSIKTIFRDICRLLESTPMDAGHVDPRWRILCVVCSIIKSFASYLLTPTLTTARAGARSRQEDATAKEFEFRICEEIVDIAIMLCVSGQAVESGKYNEKVVEVALDYVWEMLDTVVPLLKPCNGKVPLVKWEGYQNLKRECILKDQPELLSSLWDTVHDLTDRLLSPHITFSDMGHNQGHGRADWQETWSCVADCAVEVMLLLHNAHSRFPDLVALTIEEDRALMVHFCLELMDELTKAHQIAYQPQPASDPRVLACALVPWVTKMLGENPEPGLGNEGAKDLMAWLEMLLDGLCDSLLREADDALAWVALQVYMNALLSCFHPGPPSSSSVASSSASSTRLELNIYPAPDESLSHSWIRLRLKYQGHKELLTGLWWRWNAAAKVLFDQIQQRALQAEREAVNPRSPFFGRSRVQGQQDGSEGFRSDAQDLSRLGRIVSDILTLMRMIVHEGLKQGQLCRQLDLESVSWIMDLIDSKPVTDAAQILRDLSAVASASAPTKAVAGESNVFVASLNELAKLREECVRVHARYRY